jgi:acetylornithine deacetylase/succinyl-diaminopimelate desuccinylase-like protein
MTFNVVDALCQLVRIPSVNPMGRPLDGPEFYEYRVTDFLQAQFEEHGLPWERQHVAPRRENILARVDGRTPVEEGGELILLEAHQDTVPVDGMTIPPWCGELREGRVWGRGACDIKGGLASMLAALFRLAEERPTGRPTVIFAATVNEEHGFTGATSLARLWSEGKSRLLPRPPDGAIVAEPTQLNVVVAHKGMVRWRCRTRGRSGHSSSPQPEQNAIYKMSRVLAALESYALAVTPKLREYPLVGRPTLSVGTIAGGLSVNTVPAACTIEIDRRVVPDEDPQAAHREVVDYVARFPGVEEPPDHERPFMFSGGLPSSRNGELADRLVAAASRCGVASGKIGVPFGTDASAFAAADVPSVVFGPGDVAQAHTADEWVDSQQVERAAEVLYEFLASQ